MMKSFITKPELEELQAFNEPYCLSVYVPFIEPNTPANPAQTAVKNILHEAKTTLESIAAPHQHIRKIMDKVGHYLDEYESRPTRHESLALFVHPDFFRSLHVPDSIPYQLTIETGFNTDPLRQIIENDQHYYVLALAHKQVQLYEGSKYNLEPVNLEGFPSSMKETLNIDEYPKSRETHTVAPASSGKGSEAYHQQYNVSQTDKDLILQFFRRIDRYLHTLLNQRQIPLVIAGVEYLPPIYRKVNTYPGLLSESIAGNQTHADLAALRDKALRLVEKYKHQPTKKT